ncbi:MAG TPA: Gfo/Idh/MocA family oxidoreductase [Bacteroidales bacterium]|nr:Gfo/Idh/MocA family oxidoreductase [Bacteroidales bacterium]HOU96732.1 Gfo/Idh/MocA family oxidoreductase [Bacteroidales bacterium]HQG53753.1 Gfo/Idh/MocA family oxidoreductase [Bacteroidales bacterium]HQJ21434.1 Gfo/Idh/MocA family oxidoreductase [Bacteroidales bacterium]HRC89114.1 Gfo/Idh/MocA family oxidoreductase [Bacteroidales bacterium]
MATRREFIQKAALGSAAVAFSAKSYSRIIGANDRVRVGIIGYSDRFRGSLYPSFMANAKEMNFEFTALSDIWRLRREEADKFFKSKGVNLKLYRNNEELYSAKDTDAVIISTADFQHALHCAEAVRAGRDAYVEKPFAETMADARTALKAVQETGKIVQIGSQRRSAPNYIAANDYIRSGKFGKIVMVEMTWNVNQPGRWRRPNVVPLLKEEDTDWKRYLLNRPFEPFNARKYLEFRLFWPYSSGIPGQWMAHQIDTVHWFTGLSHPRSVAANGGIYLWKDGRTNFDTMTAVFDYGSDTDPNIGFQVVYSSRFTNSAGGTKELYFSNGGTLNLDTNKVTPEGGLQERDAKAMNMKANLLEPFELPGFKVETAADTGGDPMTTAHMRNWMECVRDRKKPNADIVAGYNHSIANIMCTACLRTGEKVTFDEKTQEVMAGGKPFQY